jgi:hypothetical protein
MESRNGNSSKAASSSSTSLGWELEVHNERHLLRAPLSTRPLLPNTKDSPKDDMRNAKIPLLSLSTAQGEWQTVSVSPCVSRQEDRAQQEYVKCTNVLQMPASLGELKNQLYEAAPRLGYRSHRLHPPLNGPHKSRIPRVRQRIQPLPQSVLAKASQGCLHNQYSFREPTGYSLTDDFEDDIPLAQDGPYPKIPGRILPDIEELTRPRAMTARSGSSRGTQQCRDRHCTLEGNGSPRLRGHPLELPHRSQVPDSLSHGFGRSLGGPPPVAAEHRSFQSDMIPLQAGQRREGKHRVSMISKHSTSLHLSSSRK